MRQAVEKISACVRLFVVPVILLSAGCGSIGDENIFCRLEVTFTIPADATLVKIDGRLELTERNTGRIFSSDVLSGTLSLEVLKGYYEVGFAGSVTYEREGVNNTRAAFSNPNDRFAVVGDNGAIEILINV